MPKQLPLNLGTGPGEGQHSLGTSVEQLAAADMAFLGNADHLRLGPAL